MKTNKKIVFLAISSELGGAERSLIDLVSQSQLSYSDQEIVIVPRHGPLTEELLKLNIQPKVMALPVFFESISRKNKLSVVLFLLLGIPAYCVYTLQLKSFLKKQDIQALHSTGLKNHILCCLLSLITPHHYYIHFRDFINSRFLNFFFSCFSNKKNIHWMAASESITKNLHWHVPVFYDGLSEKVFYKNSSTEIKEKLGLQKNSILIAHAAALTPWKGQLCFIEAAAQVLSQKQDTSQDLHFVIIGSAIYKTNSDKNYLQDLKSKVQSLQLTQHVHFLPFIKNSREIYDNIDVFVHCSLLEEPFGRVVLEALFCEKPTVASHAGGVLEILRLNSAKKYLHKPGDAKSLSHAIVSALDFKNYPIELTNDAKNRFPANTCYKRQVDYLNEPHSL